MRRMWYGGPGPCDLLFHVGSTDGDVPGTLTPRTAPYVTVRMRRCLRPAKATGAPDTGI